MTMPMPSPDLLTAISRLDQAVSRAEASLDAARSTLPGENSGRDDIVRKAISELDDIIGTLRKNTDG